ncbi:E3 ubiquitin-protein ligase RAD18 isoform X2 [Ambystoma mexicanum]
MIIPQCSHNYCSLCIRKFLSYKTQCPTCCMAVVEPDLRNNRVLDELVKNFNSARQHLFQFVLDTPPLSPPTLGSFHSSNKMLSTRSKGCSRKKQESACMDNFLVKANAVKAKSTEGSTTKVRTPIKIEGQWDTKETMEATSSPSSSNGVSSPGIQEVKKVDCPVCGVGIPEQYINRHLDSCLASDEKKESLRSSAQKRKTMAKVVYNLLSDRDLRKRLKEVGLSSHGTKQQLIKRHVEFVHMFNAQCDSLNPKSAAEIVKEIEQNEKIRAQLQTKRGENSLTFSKDQSEQEIEGIHSDYRQKHKNEFQFLVDQVKNRRKKAVKIELKEDEDSKQIPTRLEDNLLKDCSHELSEADTSQDTDIMLEGEANQFEHGLLVNDCGEDLLVGDTMNEVQAKMSPNVNMGRSGAGRSPDVNEEGPYRSESPSFPLSPHSIASSSSDILRDLEEIKDDGPSNFNVLEVKPGKRKSSGRRTQEVGKIVTRSKRSRK